MIILQSLQSLKRLKIVQENFNRKISTPLPSPPTLGIIGVKSQASSQIEKQREVELERVSYFAIVTRVSKGDRYWKQGL